MSYSFRRKKQLTTLKNVVSVVQLHLAAPDAPDDVKDGDKGVLKYFTKSAFRPQGADALNKFVSAVQEQRSEVLKAMQERAEELLCHSKSLISSASIEEVHHHLTEIVNLGGPEVSAAWAAAKVGVGIASLSAGHVALGCCIVAFALGSLGSSLMWGAYRDHIRSGGKDDGFLSGWMARFSELQHNILRGSEAMPSQPQPLINPRRLDALGDDKCESTTQLNYVPKTNAYGYLRRRSKHRHSCLRSTKSCNGIQYKSKDVNQVTEVDAWESQNISGPFNAVPEECTPKRGRQGGMPFQGSRRQKLHISKPKENCLERFFAHVSK